MVSIVGLISAACNFSRPEMIVITVTFDPNNMPIPTATSNNGAVAQTDSSILSVDQIVPTPDPTRPLQSAVIDQYIVQPGDTLTGISARFGVQLETLLVVNDIANADILQVGQVLQLPAPPTERGSDFKIIPDSRLVRAPGSGAFDIAGFIESQPGYINGMVEVVDEHIMTAAQIIERISLDYSVDARLLLALLEFKAGWLSNPQPDETLRAYPMGAPANAAGVDRLGLYRQLAWAADQLNLGYYGWKLRGLTIIEFDDGVRLLYSPNINAGTVGVQYFLSRNSSYLTWNEQIAPNGFYSVYARYFGDPFVNAIEPIIPPGLTQPNLLFPFSQGETWFFTGGPHGGYGTGSAWASIDFAPPDERPQGSSPCYISDYFATAAAPGLVVRSESGFVVLDLDMDGDESTGWTLVYLHLAERDRVLAGTMVDVGDRLGRPSCEGGFSNGTHMHFGRRYNGEWIPVTCDVCAPGYERPPFVIDGWTVIGLPGQEYQGYLVRGDERRIAEQGRLITENRVSW